MLGTRIQRRNISFRIDIPPLNIEAVEGEIRQIISNLITNAIDASPVKGVVTIRARKSRITVNDRSHPAVRISIADTGDGIPPESRNRIFEPFFTTKQDLGTGLGLWVVREIVTKHGGHIHLRSRTGSGTVLSILLPASQDPLSR